MTPAWLPPTLSVLRRTGIAPQPQLHNQPPSGGVAGGAPSSSPPRAENSERERRNLVGTRVGGSDSAAPPPPPLPPVVRARGRMPSSDESSESSPMSSPSPSESSWYASNPSSLELSSSDSAGGLGLRAETVVGLLARGPRTGELMGEVTYDRSTVSSVRSTKKASPAAPSFMVASTSSPLIFSLTVFSPELSWGSLPNRMWNGVHARRSSGCSTTITSMAPEASPTRADVMMFLPQPRTAFILKAAGKLGLRKEDWPCCVRDPLVRTECSQLSGAQVLNAALY
mmetsp:Transcript_89313/g.254987  ORF Transcript_89313/g.254987 Transcript_89313/m.254987 type:complete len:284 (-) Transcript_89313:25-876(-)